MDAAPLNPQHLLKLTYTREGLRTLHGRIHGTSGAGLSLDDLAAAIWRAAATPSGHAVMRTYLVQTAEQLRADRNSVAADASYKRETARRAALTRLDQQLARVGLLQTALEAVRCPV